MLAFRLDDLSSLDRVQYWLAVLAQLALDPRYVCACCALFFVVLGGGEELFGTASLSLYLSDLGSHLVRNDHHTSRATASTHRKRVRACVLCVVLKCVLCANVFFLCRSTLRIIVVATHADVVPHRSDQVPHFSPIHTRAQEHRGEQHTQNPKGTTPIPTHTQKQRSNVKISHTHT